MTIEPTRAGAQSNSASRSGSLPIVLLVVGVGLILGSFFPIGQLATQSMWTKEDATAYDRLSLEFHMSAYRSAARAGLTKEQMAQRQQSLKKQFEKMQGRLKRAQQQPAIWSRYLLWSGATLTVVGGMGYSRNQ